MSALFHKTAKALSLAMLLGLWACQTEDPAAEDQIITSAASQLDFRFKLLDSTQTGIDFSNDLEVDLTLNIFNYLYYYNGGGLAAADFNGDGLQDLLFSSNLGAERMYLNQGEMKFQAWDNSGIDGGANSWSTGLSVVDINADGLMDVYLCQVGKYRELDCRNRLFVNQGNDESGHPLFEEKASEYGLDFQGFSTQAGFFDYDLDGDLDCYLMNHSLHHNGTFGQRTKFIDQVSDVSGDRLYRNDDGKYVDVSREAGIMSSVIGYGLGLSFADFNLDGYPDIYVGNDFHENDYLYINQGDGSFRELIAEQMAHSSRFSMGVETRDLNGDLFADVISLDMLPEDPEILKRSEGEDALDIFNFKLGYGYAHQYARNCVQINNGFGRFAEMGRYAGVFATDWSWSALVFDMNLDGTEDLFISNGIPKRMNDIDYIDFMSGNDLQYKIQFDQLTDQDAQAIERIPEIKLLNKFYLGADELQFEDVSEQVESTRISYSNSALALDLDGDGDEDLVCNNIAQSAFVYENQTEAGKSLSVLLKGSKENPSAIGTKIIAFDAGRRQLREHFPLRGFQGSSLGREVLTVTGEKLDSVLIIWPDGSYLMERSISPGEHTFSYQPGLPIFDYSTLKREVSFEIKSEGLHPKADHVENPFVEFNREVLIPHAVSTEGPALAVGDVNGDGLEDVYVGSAKRKHPGIFIQKPDASLEHLYQPAFMLDSIYEEVEAELADFDLDGDLDLIVATGGNEYRLNSHYTSPIIYLNDGSGVFERSNWLDEFHLTAACLVLWDFDSDGDPDIFLGARAEPWYYGPMPRSVLLRNDTKGKFVDCTDQFLPDQGRLGLVTDASLIEREGKQSLIYCSEWGGSAGLEYQGDKKSMKSWDLGAKPGLWRSIYVEDLDGDGLQDVILGNQGLNNRYEASASEPLRLYLGDFDGNGNPEQLLTYYLQGKEIPFHNKKELEKRLPFVRKRFVSAASFAKADLKEIFDPESLEDVLEVHQLASRIFYQNRDGFEGHDLPWEMQDSPLQAYASHDFNGDGNLDLLCFGNFYEANVQMGRYDADLGKIILNDGERKLKVAAVKNQRDFAQARNLESIKIGAKDSWILVNNGSEAEIISVEHVK